MTPLSFASTTITASLCTNGTIWITVSSVTMETNSYIGLGVSSGSVTTLNTPVVDNVTVEP